MSLIIHRVGALLGSRAMVIAKKRGRENLESLCWLSSTPSSESSFREEPAGTAASRWSKEVMGAVETHVCLLQQHYHPKRRGQHREHITVDNRTLCSSDWGSNEYKNGVFNSNDIAVDGNDEDDNEQNDTRAVQLPDLINEAAALPEGWEQHLDLRTGQIFYIHWKSCKKSIMDPRKMVHLANESILKLMHHTQKEPSSIEPLASMKEEELLESSPSECITSQSLLMSSCIGGDEVQSKYTPYCCLDPKD
ncbi:hypothetical protein L7F22_031954 [Adiantum nelumboides]|nr:hypothetical protein [Adiantum nelumboides]